MRKTKTMKLDLTTCKPFSLAQSIAFLRRFVPCTSDYILTDDSITAAVVVDRRATTFTLRGDREVTLESPDAKRVRVIASDFVGASDDLTAFYAAAAGDPPMKPLVEALYGLHHARFLTLGEIAVYCVMMQRNPIERAAQLKRAFFESFGVPVVVGDRTLRALPELDTLAGLSAAEIGEAIRHRPKAEQIVRVVAGVAAIGETMLRDAPYAEARDRLLEVKGIGPFSAAAILLRGLGRMDELPWMDRFSSVARELYGDDADGEALAGRYGRSIGYWSFYAMTGMERIAPFKDSGLPSSSASRTRSRGAAGRAAPRRSSGKSRGSSSSRSASPAS